MIKPFSGDQPVTQIFNDSCCRASYAKFGMQGHNGIDYGLPCGTPVIAAFNGTIYSGFEANGYGNYIFLRDDQGNEAVYGHLSRIQVGSGRVSEGQQIGLSGTTGNSTGCHLHFGYRPIGYNRNNGFLGYVNPTFNAGTPAQGGTDVVIQGENEFARANQLHVQLLGRPLSRETFNNLVGKSWLNVIEIFSDHKETRQQQEVLQVGRVAVADKWQQQIYDLQAQNKTQQSAMDEMGKQIRELQAQVAVQSDDTKLLNGFGEWLQKIITRLGVKK